MARGYRPDASVANRMERLEKPSFSRKSRPYLFQDMPGFFWDIPARASVGLECTNLW
jgi:hypothetical protein